MFLIVKTALLMEVIVLHDEITDKKKHEISINNINYVKQGRFISYFQRLIANVEKGTLLERVKKKINAS